MAQGNQDLEKQQLIAALGGQRWMFLQTADGLSDEQARMRPTVSELSIGGLIKHLTVMERQWTAFARGGAPAMAAADGQEFDSQEAAYAAWQAQFRMDADETLGELIGAFHAAAANTDAYIAELADLEAQHALPPRPWFEPGAEWSARQTFLHLLVEIAQHSGHADILREAIDGHKSTG